LEECTFSRDWAGKWATSKFLNFIFVVQVIGFKGCCGIFRDILEIFLASKINTATFALPFGKRDGKKREKESEKGRKKEAYKRVGSR
jgi:hypothetical protein